MHLTGDLIRIGCRDGRDITNGDVIELGRIRLTFENAPI
jgi:hypothetical protein